MSTTVGDVKNNVCYIHEDEKFFCINPTEFRFEKDIDTKASSKTHRLFFTGSYFDSAKEASVTWEDFSKKQEKDKLFTELKNEIVYEESFNEEIERGATKVVQLSKKTFPHQEEYLSFFSDLNRSLVSWVEKSDDIHKFVTERGTREIYDQVIERLKPRKNEGGFVPSNVLFEKSKFIFLLADLQRDEKQQANFKNDLKIYTKGIVTDIAISTKGTNKGEINIDSPNGPRDIWTISHGTSVLLFFILLLNWVRLPEREKSFKSPNILILDEIDSLIHPTLMDEFTEVLRSLSEKVQLFMSSHSPYFIDGFEKSELFLLKDTPSQAGNRKLANRCNIYDYQEIISLLPEKDRAIFSEKKNSELFVDGLIDEIFPNKLHD